MKIEISTEYITLGQLLKMADFVSSGGEAKAYLAEKVVTVGGEHEDRRGRKLYPGDTVKTGGVSFTIVRQAGT